MPTPATRRPRGAPRGLLLDAARALFARQDYRSTTTREIAQAAGVTEHLLFRHFGSKAALFREALVLPFTSFVDEFGHTWQSVVPEETDEQERTRLVVGQLTSLVTGDLLGAERSDEPDLDLGERLGHAALDGQQRRAHVVQHVPRH